MNKKSTSTVSKTNDLNIQFPKKGLASTSKAITVNPIRRDLEFPFDFSKLNHWHGEGPMASHFLNTLSLFFPDGEQFFIDSVRHYRSNGAITDKALLEDVRNFIGQEAMHRREHIGLNRAMDEAGLNAKGKEKQILAILAFAKKRWSPEFQLALTCALEHLTATLADGLLRWPELIPENSEPAFRDGWEWHALEETEHKSVAFEVYRQAVGTDANAKAYALRVSAHVVANAAFWPLVAIYMLDIARRNGDLTDIKGWSKAASLLLGRKPGLLRRKLPEWFAYFKPGFHPWQLDNRDFLQRTNALVETYAKAA